MVSPNLIFQLTDFNIYRPESNFHTVFCFTMGFVFADSNENPKKHSEVELITLHDSAMDTLGSAKCRAKFRKYINEKALLKAFS